MELVALELDLKQTQFLTLCTKNYATLSFMHDSGVFDIYGGSAFLTFDVRGVLKTIRRELYSHAKGDNSL